MPMVKDKKFTYTAKGKKEAKEYGKKVGAKPMNKPPMKKTAGRGR
jgi:hypothetical protein